MNMTRKRAKRKKLLKRKKETNERRKDNMPVRNNLFFHKSLRLLLGIFISYTWSVKRGNDT